MANVAVAGSAEALQHTVYTFERVMQRCRCGQQQQHQAFARLPDTSLLCMAGLEHVAA